MTRQNLQKIIEDLRREEKTKVAIFMPKNSKLDRYNSELYNCIKETLDGRVKLISIDDIFLNSYEGMKLIDILFILEGEGIPTYYLPRIKDFLHKGGAIIVLSKNFPFMNLEEFEKQYGLTAYILKDTNSKDEFYRRTTAYMGLKTYTSDIKPTKAVFDRDFLLDFPEEIKMDLSYNGIYCNTSSERWTPYPPFGNVFPERYEVLRNYVVVKGTDDFGKHLTSSVVFTQNWENGSRMAFISLDKTGEYLKEYLIKIITNAINFCSNKVFISSIESDYACYKDGEPVKINTKIVNFSDSSVRAELKLEIEGDSGDGWFNSKEVKVAPKSNLKDEICWFPESFLSDFYTVRVKLIVSGKVASKAENGFVIWKAQVAYNKKNKVDIHGRYFLHGDMATVITGANYYESHIGELMWIKPNVKELRDDLKAMADSGLNYIRIHYHHAKWFIDYLKNSIGQIPSYFEEINQSYLPDEKTWRVLDAHIYLCQKFGLIYGGDLLTLVPEEMGDPTGWIGVQDRVYLEEKKKHQKEFLKLLARRYRDVPGIAWDLWNEPENLESEEVLRWAKEMRETLRENGDTHPITIGTGNSAKYEEVIDFYGDHRNFKDIPKVKYETDKPVIAQEVWLDRPQTLEGDIEQASDMFRALLDTFRIGLSGFSPWQWTNQARLWNDYRVTWHELWDDRLGCCVRNDGTLKPAGRIYRDFSVLLKTINFLHYEKGLISTNKGILEIFPIEGNETGFGKVCLIHYNLISNSLYAGIIRRVIKIRNKVYIESDKDNYIWFFSGDGEDIYHSKNLYIKTEVNCNLRIFREIEKEALKLELVDYTSEGWKFISLIEYTKDKDLIEVSILPWFVNYWIRIKF